MKIRAGTWVTMKPWADCWGKYGRYMRSEGEHIHYIETDGSRKGVCCVREDFSVNRKQIAPHSWFPMRKRLPYGRYIRADGSWVFHNRDYEPLDRDPKTWIAHEREEWFYLEGSEPWHHPAIREKVIAILLGNTIKAEDIVYAIHDRVPVKLRVIENTNMVDLFGGVKLT